MPPRATEKQKQLPAETGQTQAIQPTKAATEAVPTVERVGRELQEITLSNFYSVSREGGETRMVPDARALQHYANKPEVGGIATQIMDAGLTSEKGWAHVRGWKKNDPTGYKEDFVTILFSTEFERLVWDRIEKGCRKHKNTGCPLLRKDNQIVFINDTPVLSDPECQLALRRQLNRIKAFADRTCVTKAEARIHMKLLNFEWRDEDEIEAERSEARTAGAAKPVSNAQAETQSTAQATAQPKPAAPAPAAATALPATAPKNATAPPAKQTGPMAPPPASAPPRTQETAQAPAAAAPAQPATNGTSRTKRLELIGDATHCSTTNLTVFLCRYFGAKDTSKAEMQKIGAKRIEAFVATLEEAVKHFKGDLIGTFIRDEQSADPEFNALLKFFGEHFAKVSA